MATRSLAIALLVLAGCGDDLITPASPDALTPDAGMTDAASPDALPHGDFVYVCGQALCLHGQPFRIKGATVYGALGNIPTEIALAQQARLDVLELVEFETRYHNLADTMSEATWTRVDRLIAAANAQG